MYIFSVDRPNQDNMPSNNFARKMLTDSGASFNVMIGVYKGIGETSFITNSPLAIDLARSFQQETYLEEGHYGFWNLIDVATGNVLKVYSTIHEVTAERARKEDSYSILNGRHYIGKEIL